MLSQGQEAREIQEAPKELTARVVPGTGPGAMDAIVEVTRLGLGPRQADWFVSGVYIVTIGLPSALRGNARRWEEAGEKWAREEIARRAALSEASR